jgi:hypothetical protein
VWCPHLEPRAQDTALAESEGGRLLFFWRLVLHPAASWSPAIRARIHAPIRGNEGLSGRNCFLWHRSHAIRCMSAPSPCDPSPETRLLTTICSSASRSASRPAGLISWAARTSSFISLSWAACAHIWLARKVGYGYAVYQNGRQIASGHGAINPLSHVFDAEAIGAWKALQHTLRLPPDISQRRLWLCIDGLPLLLPTSIGTTRYSHKGDQL